MRHYVDFYNQMAKNIKKEIFCELSEDSEFTREGDEAVLSEKFNDLVTRCVKKEERGNIPKNIKENVIVNFFGRFTNGEYCLSLLLFSEDIFKKFVKDSKCVNNSDSVSDNVMHAIVSMSIEALHSFNEIGKTEIHRFHEDLGIEISSLVVRGNGVGALNCVNSFNDNGNPSVLTIKSNELSPYYACNTKYRVSRFMADNKEGINVSYTENAKSSFFRASPSGNVGNPDVKNSCASRHCCRIS